MAAISLSALAASDTVKQAQQKLNAQGLNAGQADGKVGPQTQKAVKEFQQSKGLQPTGKLDRRTLAALGVEENASAGRATK
jgi:peptidoglycan hydrolase-like protein with peptidoglycan-binding domain